MKSFNPETGFEFGVVYYPEQWEESLWVRDAVRMRDMGVKVVRMMEFAWAVLEPGDGKFDFSLFDRAIELFAGYGIKTILGTPTAAFPAWLYTKDPAILQIHPTRAIRDFGARRNGCYNSGTYLTYSARIVEKTAEHFGRNPSVIGWQLDNEIGHEGSDVCVCNNCHLQWQMWLKNKYQDIHKLNQTWGTVFWSTQYSNFEQIPLPRSQISSDQNPGLCLDYDRFSSDALIHFIQEQIKILRNKIIPLQWISTNLYMPPLATVIDMEKLFEKMDFAGYDNYPVWGDQDGPIPYYFNAFILSYIRGLKKNLPFTIFEQLSGIQGHKILGYLPSEAETALWTNQAVAYGANRLIYFRWRTLPYAQEQLCYGILDSDDLDNERKKVLGSNLKKNRELFESIASVPIESTACVIYDMDNRRVISRQNLTQGLHFSPVPFLELGYVMETARHYAPFDLFHINADVMTPESVNLNQYKIISLPLYQMADPAFAARLADWVKDGGSLILSWRTGTRDLNDHSVCRELPGVFHELAGARVKKFESLNRTKVKIQIGFFPAEGENWADILELDTAKALGYYTDSRKHYRGKPCASVNSFGKGKVFYIGTSPGPAGLYFLYKKIFKIAGIRAKFMGLGIESVQRITRDGKVIELFMNFTAKKKKAEGLTLPPYGMVIKNR